ncbi:MAG TPA: hypothetical protein VKX25_06565 [Bryobacteraceae bacterium]|jgi:hypothetical protein|nr:hypothetical protein [Bryobacteraceae bacterium]
MARDADASGISAETGNNISDGISGAADRVSNWLAQRVGWTRHSWLTALFLLAVAVVIAWPDFGSFRHYAAWPERAMNWKIEHPLEAIPVENYGEPAPDLEGTRAHIRKRTYRVTVLLIAHWLGWDMRAAARFSFACSCIFIWLLVLNLRRLFPDDLTAAFLLGLALAGSLIVQWGLNDYFFFDGVGYMFLAAACLTRSPWLLTIYIIAGGFNDERVILVLPLLYLLHGSQSMSELSLPGVLRLNRPRLGLLAGLLGFLVLRFLFALKVGHLYDSSVVGIWMLLPNLLLLPANALSVFKGTILILTGALLVLALRRSYGPLLILLLAALPSVGATLVVGDLGRTLAYSFPLLFLCAKVIRESFERDALRRVLLYAALFSVFLPTYYLWEERLVPFKPLPYVSAANLIHFVRHH